MIKAAFFDIDGTLVSFNTHKVPSSTVNAFARMCDRGIKLFIATGRAPYDLPPVLLEIFEQVPFDGFLMFNGQLCYDDVGVYRDVHIDEDDVRVFVEDARAGECVITLMQQTRAFLNRRDGRVRASEEHVGGATPLGDLDTAFDELTYQICAFVEPGEEERFMRTCQGVEHTRWCDYFCDIIPAGGGKPAGIAAALDRFDIKPEECIAFGDGGNDVPMFGCVDQSVAVGDASDAVKAAATYVTDFVDEDGILHACEHFGLV